MKSLAPIAVLVLLGMLPHAAFANGGGYVRGGVAETGTVTGFEPEGTEAVRILDELLTVTLAREEARVEVRYILKNMTKRPVKVRFGFPVEESSDGDMFVPNAPAPSATLEHLGGYSVEVGGQAVGVAFEREPRPIKPEDQSQKLKGIGGWMISQVKFGPGEEKTMRIRYRAPFGYSVSSVSDDTDESARIFKYRLSTGAVWNGPIERGKIVIASEGVRPDEIRVRRPVNKFAKSGNRWEWSFTELEPTLADDIEVEAIPAESTSNALVAAGATSGEAARAWVTERGGKWYASHANYAVKASSTLPSHEGKSYAAGNVKGDGTWSEGAPGAGVGEWLEFTPEVARPLRAIGIRPGYGPSEDVLFLANARPKRVTVKLNEEHEFEAVLADKDDMQWMQVIDYEKPVKKVRLTFAEVYPGTRFEDLCVSGVMLEVPLSKKPTLQPAR